MSKVSNEGRSNTGLTPAEGEERECFAFYFGIFIYEIQKTRKVKGIRLLLNFLGTGLINFSVGYIVCNDVINSLVRDPEIQEEWLKMSEQNKLITILFISVVMLLMTSISKITFLNALTRTSRLPLKGQWNDENIKDALMVILDVGTFIMLTYILMQISWYFTYIAISVVFLSALLYRLFEKMSLHCDNMQLIQKKLNDKEEMARIQKIIDEKGEYYDESINTTICKKEGEKIMKILRGEEK